MKATRLQAAALVFAAILAALPASAQNPTHKAADRKIDDTLSYSTFGHGPSIVLLYDDSPAGLRWADAARALAARFEVTLVDVSALLAKPRAEQRLRDAFARRQIEARRLAGCTATEALARRYALAYPTQSRSFILPHCCEDLETLAALFSSTPFCKS